MKNMDELRSGFQSLFVGFTSFEDAGQDYHHQEYDYKKALSDRMREVFAPWVSREADSWEQPEFLAQLQKTLAESVEVDGKKFRPNFTNWRDHQELFNVFLATPANLSRFMPALHRLLKAADSDNPINDELGQLLQIVREGELPANLSKAIPTLLLFYWRPDRYPFVKARAFDTFLRSVGKEPLGDGTHLTVEMFQKILEVFKEVRAALSDWRPRDMIDLQTFYWRSAERSKSARESDEASPPPKKSNDTKTTDPPENQVVRKLPRRYPLNLILYGPPGTGKTYRTISLATSICNGVEPMNHAEAVSEFERLRREGRIEFVTFHQSYGYEEFVEGIRPVLETDTGGDVLYKREAGIFRRMALRASAAGIRPEGGATPTFDSLWDALTTNIAESGYLLAESQTGKSYMLELSQRGSVLSFPCKVDAEGNAKKTNDSCQTASQQNARLYWDHREFLGPDPADFTYQKTLELFSREKGNKGGNHYTALWVVYAQLLELASAAMAGTKPIADADKRAQEIIEAGEAGDRLHFDASTPRYVLVIDEINRGNISKIMGELITLLEPDKRLGSEHPMTVRLPGSQAAFAIPPNLYVVGTMNSADRSIAFLDTALRRRFQFEEIEPLTRASWKQLSEASEDLAYPVIDGIDVPEMLETMNRRVELLYDRDHRLGHSFFIGVRSLEDLRNRFLANVIPLLQEYFYDDWKKVCLVLGCPYKWDTQQAKQVKKAPPIVRLSALSTKDVLGVNDSDDYDLDNTFSYEVEPAFRDATSEELKAFFAGVTADPPKQSEPDE